MLALGKSSGVNFFPLLGIGQELGGRITFTPYNFPPGDLGQQQMLQSQLDYARFLWQKTRNLDRGGGGDPQRSRTG